MVYAAMANPADRVKAVTAVAVVHAFLALIILTGLNVRTIAHAVERLQTFDLREEPPPPPVKPPPSAPKPQQMKKAAGAPAKKAEASPIVAPPPRIPVPSPVPAAKIAGSGSASSSGAALSGNGTGAGGVGNGPGGGGYGDFSRFTPARIIRRIPNSEYRRISAGRLPSGTATIAFRVTPEGAMAGCRVTRSSGDGYVDAMVCNAATRNMRFSPALDPSGRPVAQDMSYTPTWRPY
jgi:periplasmic protein TonB